ncbi:uncharacterized protein EV422DRAFT_566949 [Fimicolochytrium jonesii]|uniref:uncharacterized protein n=1 Tax=Fimicolochytrium jonesii TaxID=1396493 RepID=UPI0022FED16F|nr:uncharacterized protein EV422DRAFT_566949 [Fimicolochytrium jonesii]KAI8821844.1 hypothetical protein EV422DRAFT_566949 [Fimicolochytrium jonesii]
MAPRDALPSDLPQSPYYMITPDPVPPTSATLQVSAHFLARLTALLQFVVTATKKTYIQLRTKNANARVIYNEVLLQLAQQVPNQEAYRHILLNVTHLEDVEAAVAACDKFGLGGVHISGAVLKALCSGPPLSNHEGQTIESKSAELVQIDAALGVLQAHRFGRAEDTLAADPESLLPSYIMAASCHSVQDILLCTPPPVSNSSTHPPAFTFAFVVLSPVALSTSCPPLDAAATLGWDGFERILRDAKDAAVDRVIPPVYALGGVGLDDISTAMYKGAVGVAAIKAFWNAHDLACDVLRAHLKAKGHLKPFTANPNLEAYHADGL